MSCNVKGAPCNKEIKPYKDLKCEDDEHAHHIVPDFALRFGTRNDAIGGKNRIKGMPSLEEGPAICLPGKPKIQNATKVPSKHTIAHQNTDPRIKALGQKLRTEEGAKLYPPGTAPLSEILGQAIAGTSAAIPECGTQIKKAVNRSFENADPKAPCRTTKMPPSRESESFKRLSNYKQKTTWRRP